jgi:hypothetical protein
MARIRTIKPSLFRHELLFEIEQETGLPIRLSFAGLLTAADREGRFRWSPRQLKLDCLPYDDVDFSLVLDALWKHGLVLKYQTPDGEFGFIPTWHKHQHVNQREAASELPEPKQEHMCEYSADTCAHVQARGEQEGKGREGKGTDIRAVAHATRPALDSAFADFWKAYPSRGKARNPRFPARKKFEQVVRGGEDPEKIIAAAKMYSADMRSSGKFGTELVAQAVTWLNQRSDLDYVPYLEAVRLGTAAQTIEPNSPEFQAWLGHHTAAGNKARVAMMNKAIDENRPFTVPSRWPPGYEKAA